jgi:hypothetical protein
MRERLLHEVQVAADVAVPGFQHLRAQRRAGSSPLSSCVRVNTCAMPGSPMMKRAAKPRPRRD